MIQRKSEVIEYIKDLIGSFYQQEIKKDTICVLCEGIHGNNTLCQMDDSRGEIC
jgi:hypothetical protein